MTRPKDEDGRLLQPPHKRLDNAAELEQAGVFAISKDGRAVALPLARKLAMVRKVINHIFDGDKVPKWITKNDPDDKDNHALLDPWRTAEQAVRQVGRAA